MVYILKGPTNKYIGCTSDIGERLRQHNEGFSVYTKNKGPWALEWQSYPLNHSDALILEKKLKKQKGGDGLKKLMAIYKGS